MRTKQHVRIRQAATSALANQDGKRSTAMKVGISVSFVVVDVKMMAFALC